MTMYEKLMKHASDADAEADRLLQFNAASGLDRDLIIERAAFSRGQASGFRQSAFYAMILEGTPAHD